MKTEIRVPVVNANDEVVVLVRWHVPDGGEVSAGAPLCDIETTKAVVTVEAEQPGWIRHAVRENREVAVGAILAVRADTAAELAEVGAPAPAPPNPSAPSPVTSFPEPNNGTVPRSDEEQIASATPTPISATMTRLSPQAEKLAGEFGLVVADLQRANLGLVTTKGLRRLAAQVEAARVAPDPASGTLRREQVPPAKRAEIAALHQGADGALRSSLTVYFDSAPWRSANPGMPILPVVLKETARLLATRPRFTAYYAGGEVHFYDQVHLGVAIDQGEGLRVVTLRDAAALDEDAIVERLGELALDYAERKLRPEDVQHATFTVTDLSAYEVLHFEPLINGRQAAILAIGADSTLPGHPMSLTLAFDHRVLTGREVAEFLRDLREALTARAPAAMCDEAREDCCCDRCFIGVAEYYEKFGKFALMLTYVRPDGSTGRVCHSCREMN